MLVKDLHEIALALLVGTKSREIVREVRLRFQRPLAGTDLQQEPCHLLELPSPVTCLSGAMLRRYASGASAGRLSRTWSAEVSHFLVPARPGAASHAASRSPSSKRASINTGPPCLYRFKTPIRPDIGFSCEP